MNEEERIEVKMEDMIAALRDQRNAALDQVAQLSAAVASLRAKLAERNKNGDQGEAASSPD